MIIAITIVLVLIGILAFASTKPNSLNIKRVADIKAPPERIFALIDDFHNWQDWAPQDQMDPTMKRMFGGSLSGKGAFSEWISNRGAGCGRMEITESTAPCKITVRVDFVKPFAVCNINEFTLEPMDGMTRVTWAMCGTNPYIAKVMSIFVNMKRLLGKHIEAGLHSLKTVAEVDR